MARIGVSLPYARLEPLQAELKKDYIYGYYGFGSLFRQLRFMIWNLVTVGKPALPWAKAGAEDYLNRLGRHQRVEWSVIKEGPAAQVTRRMMEVSEGSLRVMLDERGRQMRSKELAQWIEKKELEGTKRVCLLIGGADGHSAELKEQIKERWSLSTLTLQHEVALVVLLEQVYRAYTVMRGEPYHRD